jgi:hypothetical protein
MDRLPSHPMMGYNRPARSMKRPWIEIPTNGFLPLFSPELGSERLKQLGAKDEADHVVYRLR